MIAAISQPYFAPFPGFFYKVQLADVLVVLDTVQFPQGTTWTSRNRFKNDQGILWLTVPVWKKGLGRQAINEVQICYAERWTQKHLASLKSAYGHAPYFAEHLPFVEKVWEGRFAKLFDMNLEILYYLLQQLGIETKIVLLSELGIQVRGGQLPVEICRRLGAAVFLVQKAAAKYLQGDLFAQAGIEVSYCKYPELVYPQLWGNFLPNLSTFDLIFNCGPKARELLRI